MFPGSGGVRWLGTMQLNLPSFDFQRTPMQPCKHPRVQVVSRDEDSEYVECLECREVFESSEFQDMAIEDMPDDEEA
jgi:hypothetical protein